MHVVAPHLTANAAAGRSGLVAAIRDHAWTLGVAVLALVLNVEHLFGVDAIARVLVVGLLGGMRLGFRRLAD